MYTPPGEGDLAREISSEASQLSERLEEMARRRVLFGRLQVAATIGAAAIVITPMIVWWISGKDSVLDYPLYLPCAVGAAFLGWLSFARQQEQCLVLTINEIGQLDCVAPLLEATRVRGMDQEAVAGALTRLLPQLSEEDADLLPPTHRGLLLSLLRPSTDPLALLNSPVGRWVYQREDFQLAALQALANLGDPSALPVVRELESAETPSVRQAAFHCRQAIESAVTYRAQTSTLLRPAEPSSDLLRPAQSAGTEAETLLRAQDGATSGIK